MNQAFALLLSVLSVAHASWLAEFTVNLAPGQIDKFVMEVHPEWAPLGAARFEELIDSNFFKGCLLYTSDAADEEDSVDLGGRRIIKKKKKKKQVDTYNKKKKKKKDIDKLE
eukprot:TRINITY_DN9758_c0_g1_i1.p1 TRINITY_DN9758_c0_g1~~TRINITY_DN9758_c0_g1_i1.p1  ORF type:complete len:112 (-),score=55.41 TRINITY_DN9758_c0_g1_i1:46-381(-)